MTDNEATGAVDHLLTDRVSAVIDRSAYGDWRSIATEDAVSLSYGFPDPALFPGEQLTDAVATVLQEQGDEVLQYGTDSYADHLEDVVEERERDRNIPFDHNDVLLTNGATHAIDTVCRVFLDPGDVILVEEPTFMGALGVFWNFGVEVVGVPVDDEGLDVDALAATLERRRERGEQSPKLLYTIPDFQNPTGTTLAGSRRERVLDLATEHDFVVLEDGAYSDLRFDGEGVPPLAAMDDSGRVVRVGTFSKTIAPGIRLGWLTAPSRIRNAARTVAAGGTNTFTRSIVGRYCAEGHLEDALPELRRAYARKRDRMLDSLTAQMPEGTTWTEPDGGFFVWVDLPEGIDADAMLEDAATRGVTYLPGSLFYSGEGPGNTLRLSYSFVTGDEIAQGIEALGTTVSERL
jgi:2-aminoadipate transaminase